MGFDTGGDGSTYLKYSGGTVVLGAGSADQLVVGRTNATFTNDVISTNGDVNAVGGFVRDHDFYKIRMRQSTTPIMSASIMSGAQGGTEGFMTWTRVPLMRAGSVVGIALLTQDCTVKSGSLSGTVLVNGTPTTATVGMNTGTIAYATFAKDTSGLTFAAGAYLEVQLTASSTYATDLDPNSGSWRCVVQVEY